MSELTPQQLRDKIAQVKKDIETVRQTGDAGHRIEIMYQYIEYLEDELQAAENKS